MLRDLTPRPLLSNIKITPGGHIGPPLLDPYRVLRDPDRVLRDPYDLCPVAPGTWNESRTWNLERIPAPGTRLTPKT